MNEIKKTKIICTIGPASEKEETLREMILAGMDVMRLNFSHGTHAEHLEKINTIRKLNAEMKSNVAILLDTKGPEIRTGDFKDGSCEFKKGSEIRIVPEDILGDEKQFSITYKDLYKDVEPGTHILVNDGAIDLVVRAVDGKTIVTYCLNTGKVKDKRGINVPGIKLGFDYLSQRDIDDLTFGCEVGVDFIAASFVRRAQDILDIRKILAECEKPNIKIIAKIENQEGVQNQEEILREADGVMVARGDLGVEVPPEMVPAIQKKLIKTCNEMGKIVVTATQMLESMQNSPVPTRAEVSDVANAIYDGTDCIMLSGESASGQYPIESVNMMARIAIMTEQNLDYGHLYRRAKKAAPKDKSEAICLSVAEMAMEFDIKAIIAFTESGSTAVAMSKYKPKCLLVGATPNEQTYHQLKVRWGVAPYLCRNMKTSEGLLNLASIIAKEYGLKAGDTVIVTGGTPGVTGGTSFLQLVEIK